MLIMMETKIQPKAYSQNRPGYDVTCLKACPSSAEGAQGGIVLVTRERPSGSGTESMRFHGTNLVSCKIVTGPNRTLLANT